jgi:RNA polymerase sigma factor (sigma-70 family)
VVPEEPSAAPPAGDIPQLAAHLFREESGKLVSVLTRTFGIEHLSLAEDVVQETLVRALQTWPFYGVPKNPAAWFTQAARNLALDHLRREKRFREKEPQIIAHIEQWGAEGDAASPAFDEEIKDGRLRLFFVCSHPALPPEVQTALALKTLCGFSPAEIAKAFLTSEAAIAKRLVRAKQRIRELGIPFEIPAGEELSSRLDAVLHTLYLLFNEGYKASSGANLVREELCSEAIRLGALLVEHPSGNQPRVHALLALMLLNAARLRARTDNDGNILRLQDQDRSLWNRELIARGVYHLGCSAVGSELSEYHLQAGIAACHCLAPDYKSTDWPRILSLYDQLIELNDSPIVALNRAVAVAQVEGPEAGIDAVEKMAQRKSLESYYLLYAVLAELNMQLGRLVSARQHWRTALDLAEVDSELAFLRKKLAECEERTAAARTTPAEAQV